ARRTRADEHRIEVLREQVFQRVDALAAAEFDAEIEDIADFFVDYFFGQTETRHLGAHEAAALRIALEDDDVIAERREIARDGQRRGPRTDAGDAPAVLVRRRFRHLRTHDVRVLVVRGDALEPADRDRFGFLAVALFDTTAPARRLARTVAGATEDS